MKCPNPECGVSDLPDIHRFCFACGTEIIQRDGEGNRQTASEVNQEQIDSTRTVESAENMIGNESSKFKSVTVELKEHLSSKLA